MKAISVLFGILGTFFILVPIWLYLLHWVLIHLNAGDLQMFLMFLFWVYVPTAFIGAICSKIIETIHDK